MELIGADRIIMLVSLTLMVCYISGFFYAKTKIPDIIWVLFFGILLGPVLGFFDKDLFLYISPLMSTVALGIILFDAGITVDIIMLVETMAKSTVLSIATFLAVVLSVGFAVSYLMPSTFTLLQGMLLGSMVGGTSTIATFGILSGLERLIPDIESSRVILIMESIISDPICIIASITIIRMIMLPGVSIVDSLKDIFSTFLLSSIFGFSTGFIWAEALNKLRGRQFTYIMTLAILFPVYIMTERVIGEGGGPMAALTFGLMISNHRYLVRKIGVDRPLKINKQRLKDFHEEITFFIKAFFFVYIGLVVTMSIQNMIIGSAILAMILLVRYIVASFVGNTLNFSYTEKVLTRLIFAQGLPAFVMSQLPFIFDPERNYFLNPEIYPDLCMPIVLGTVLIAAMVGPIIAKRQLARQLTR